MPHQSHSQCDITDWAAHTYSQVEWAKANEYNYHLRLFELRVAFGVQLGSHFKFCHEKSGAELTTRKRERKNAT